MALSAARRCEGPWIAAAAWSANACSKTLCTYHQRSCTSSPVTDTIAATADLGTITP